MAVAALMRDRVKAVGNGYNPCLDGNPFALDATRVPRTIPTLVVRYDPFRQIRIEACERRQDFRAPLGVGHHRASLLGRKLGRIVEDVRQRFVEFADVVKEGYPFDGAKRMVVEPCRIAENEGVSRYSADVGASCLIVRVDRVEKGLESGGAQAVRLCSHAPLVKEQAAGRRADRKSDDVLHAPAFRKKHTGCHYIQPMTVARVNAKGARRWLGGHPWIYRTDVIERPTSDAGAVLVHDHRGKPLGWALWSPRSEISLRLLDRDPSAVIDQRWWEERIASSIARRVPLEEHTNAFRLVHGEADGCPSLVCDRYDEWLVVQFMSAGLEAFREEILASLQSLVEPAGILARNDVPLRAKEGLPRETVALQGEVPREIEVHEYDVKFLAAPWTGQKTGAFLDQRENRHFVGTVARGRALDCFSYHGSFALHLARKATHVTALDSSAPALMRAAENAERNSLTNISFIEANAFDYLREQEREGVTFDTIVLDPPAFAKTRAALPGAVRGYKDINLRAMRLLAPGGLLYTASCSFHLTKPLFLEMLEAAASDSGRRIAIRALTGQPLDHPEVLTIPETGYIKGALLEVME
jgi:23S rRNA (cytosine1962-C5)-methyltransferase